MWEISEWLLLNGFQLLASELFMISAVLFSEQNAANHHLPLSFAKSGTRILAFCKLNTLLSFPRFIVVTEKDRVTFLKKYLNYYAFYTVLTLEGFFV